MVNNRASAGGPYTEGRTREDAAVFVSPCQRLDGTPVHVGEGRSHMLLPLGASMHRRSLNAFLSVVCALALTVTAAHAIVNNSDGISPAQAGM